MRKTKTIHPEGIHKRCIICGEKLEEDEFWIIARFEKEIISFDCPSCGEKIRFKIKEKENSFTIQKHCSCDLKLTQTTLATLERPPSWRKTLYPFCKKCFEKAYAKILFAQLGDD